MYAIRSYYGFTVAVTDDEDATVTSCPGNITHTADAGVCSYTVDPTDPVFADNCGVTVVTWNMTGATVLSSPATGLNYVGSTVRNNFV